MIRKFRNFVLFALAYNLFVIVWGAFVRATGSGAGCGRHWPLCNGELIPLATSVHTQIEFFHRLTSGLSLPLVLGATYWGYQIFPKNSLGRKFSKIAGISIILEALIGAGLVLFELVSHNQSLKRTISMALHFSNTLVLMGALVLMFCAATRTSTQSKTTELTTCTFNPKLTAPLWGFTSLFAALGMAGAITALGDTLFPAQSLAHGLQADFDVASHFLVRLRVFHPILALTFTLLFTPWVYSQMKDFKDSEEIQMKGKSVIALVLLNIFLGALNLYWLAPIPLQLIHLFLGVCVWISYVFWMEALLNQTFRRA